MSHSEYLPEHMQKYLVPGYYVVSPELWKRHMVEWLLDAPHLGIHHEQLLTNIKRKKKNPAFSFFKFQFRG
jgi:hypothetical protein